MHLHPLCLSQERTLATFSARLQGTVLAAVRQGATSGAGRGFSQFMTLASYSLAFWAGAQFIDAGTMGRQDLLRAFLAVTLTAQVGGRTVMWWYGIGTSRRIVPGLGAGGLANGPAVYRPLHVLPCRRSAASRALRPTPARPLLLLATCLKSLPCVRVRLLLRSRSLPSPLVALLLVLPSSPRPSPLDLTSTRLTL